MCAWSSPMKRINCLRLATGSILGAIGVLSAGAAATVPTVANTPMQAASPLSSPRHGLATQSSLDWAGYAVSGTVFTNVAGSWTQPRATCPVNKAQPAAFWVGIDGFSASDHTVEQVGTDSDCTKAIHKKGGGPSYYAWYEMYPLPAVFLSSSSYPVAPGDAINAKVSVSATTFTLTLSDGAKWHFSTNQTSGTHPLDSSAEWITEAPTSCNGSKCKVAPLGDFGSIAITGASANGQAISGHGFTDNQITMTTKNSKIVKARTSALTAGGTAFSVSWLHN
jgi:hypothetical protein